MYHAVLNDTGQHVVVKRLHQHHADNLNSTDAAIRSQAMLFLEVFRNEVKILEACAGHPNIVKLLGRTPTCSELMLEKSEIDLHRLLRVSKTPVSLGQCYSWFRDMLFGTEYLHRIGVRAANHCCVFKFFCSVFSWQKASKRCLFAGDAYRPQA